MRRSFQTLALAAAALAACFTTPLSAKPKHPPRPVAEQKVAAPVGMARPALWKVSDADTTIYLFGTIHALPAGISWMEGPVAAAFKKSQVLVTEIPNTEPAVLQGIIMKTAMLPQGQTLHSLLTDEDKALLDKSLADNGLPPALFDGYEPWFAAVSSATLPLMKSGYSSANGVESQLAAKAKEAGIPQEGLETAEYQLGIFDKLPQKVQIRYLHEVLESLPKMSIELAQLVKFWSIGNPEKLAQLMNEDEDDPEMIEALLVNRNKNWAQWIKGRMDKPGTVFVAVGAGHLAGSDSVQAQLAKLGFKTTRIQ